MLSAIFFLILSLGMILLAAEGFTNGIELVGRRLSFSQAVVGSILAAVGTALPETILPIVAIFSHGSTASKEIGVGAIADAEKILRQIGQRGCRSRRRLVPAPGRCGAGEARLRPSPHPCSGGHADRDRGE